jgi:hypothetical protein
MLSLSEAYNKSVQEETTMTQEQLKTRHVGKQDPKRHLENAVETAMGDQVRSWPILHLRARPPSLYCAPLRRYACGGNALANQFTIHPRSSIPILIGSLLPPP